LNAANLGGILNVRKAISYVVQRHSGEGRNDEKGRFLAFYGFINLEGCAMAVSTEKRILVTGGAGLTGSALCARLVADGHDVICLDNFSTGSKRNLHNLLGNPGFEVLRKDVTLPILLEVDEIYHLARRPSRRHRRFQPVETTQTCLLGSIGMLELARRVDAKILLASSGQVYRKDEALLQAQSHPETNPSPDPGIFYREATRCSELLFSSYHEQYQVDTRIARVFNTFGPAVQTHGRSVVADFIRQALKDEDLPVYGDGSQTRAFCFVDDIVEGLVRLMNGPDDLTGPVDLGNPSEISILDLAQSIIELSGSRSGIIFEPLQEDEPLNLRPDTEPAQRRLKWHPQNDILPGLKRTIEYFRSLQAG
jgi:UDP-glucuronate decarboxylase